MVAGAMPQESHGTADAASPQASIWAPRTACRPRIAPSPQARPAPSGSDPVALAEFEPDLINLGGAVAGLLPFALLSVGARRHTLDMLAPDHTIPAPGLWGWTSRRVKRWSTSCVSMKPCRGSYRHCTLASGPGR